MIKSLRFYLQILLLLCLIGIKAISQNYPLSGTVSFIPQQSLTWSSFYTTNALTITINLKDNTSSPGPVFARIALTRQGTDIRNNESFVASQGITVNFGGITTITGIDLAENFLPSNLVSQGLDPNFFSQGGSLSSGFWTIEVILYELNAARNYRQVSDKFSYSFTQYNGLPPLLNLPSNESEIDARYGQNIGFVWTPQATSVSGQGGVSYEFSLWELGEDENANDASEGKTPIYTTSVSVPMLAYDPTKPLLQIGKRYAWQVQVKDVSGTNVYDNQGKSQVWEFRYGKTCSAPNALLLKSVGSGYHEISWGTVNLAQSYQVRWRKKSSKDDYTFQNTTSNSLVLALPSGNEYELSVQSVCSGENSPWSSDIYQENAQSGTGSTTATVIPNSATNPADIPVNGSDVNQQDYDNLVSNLQRPPTTTETRCGVSVVKDVVSCQDDEVSNTGVGNVPFTSKPNSTFYVNGYDVRITKVIDNTSGEGLLYFPILGQRIPVIWRGVQLMEGIGLHETQPYGCLTSGEVQMVGSDPTMLNRDLTSQYNNLYNSLNSPGSYSGTFGQALEAMKAKAQELLDKISKLKPGEKLSKEDYAGYNSVCKAVKKGIEAWQKKITDTYGSNFQGSSELKKIYDDLTEHQKHILSELDCNGTGYAPELRRRAENATFYASLSGETAERPLGYWLLSPCNLEGTQQEANKIAQTNDSYASLIAPPPSDATENQPCTTKLSELIAKKAGLALSFVTPDGGLIDLKSDDELIFSSNVTTSNGILRCFKRNNKNYVARIINSSSGGIFKGYVDWDLWKSNYQSNKLAPEAVFFSSSPALNKPLEVLSTRYNTDSKTVEILQAGYTATSYTKGSNEQSLVLTFRSDAPLSSCGLETGKKDSPQSYFTTEGGLDLQNKLKAYGLSDVMFELIDKSGKKTYITQNQIYPNATGTEAGLNLANGTNTVFSITEDASGLVKVTPSFKKVSTCADCASTANAVIAESLRKASAGQGQSDGKLDTQKNAINGTNLPIGINYQNMSLGSMLTAVAKGYNSVVENLKVPEYVWKPEADLHSSEKGFPVKDDWGIVTGAVNGALTEITDQAQLVGMILTVASDPIKTGTDLANFATGAITDWSKTKALIGGFAGGMVGYDATYFEPNKAPVYSGHGTGVIGGTLATQAMTGGVAVLALLDAVKDAPSKLKGELDNLAIKLAKAVEALKAKLKSFDWSDTQIDGFANKVEGWTSDDIERLLDDLGTVDKEIWEELRDGNLSIEATKALDANKILRRSQDLLGNLTFIESRLKQLNIGLTMEDIKAAIAKSDSKKSLIEDLRNFTEKGDIEGLKALCEKGITWNKKAILLANEASSVIRNSTIDAMVTARQIARESAANLRGKGETFKASLKENMAIISKNSEDIAEAVADAHFIKEGFEPVSDLLENALPGAGKAGKFDKVYAKKNSAGEIIEWKIVECKGGTSPLKGRNGNGYNQQGTKEYIQSIVDDLINKDALTSQQKRLLDNLNEALRDGKVKSYVCKQPFDETTGALKTPQIQQVQF